MLSIVNIACMDICMIVGLNFRRQRNARGWSQDELALRATIQRAYLSQIENGKRTMTLLMLQEIASALQVAPDSLLKHWLCT